MSFSIYFWIKCETNRNVKIFRMNTVKLFELVELVQLQRKDTKYCKSISPAEGLAATGKLQIKKITIRETDDKLGNS